MIEIRAATPKDAAFLGWASYEAARGHLERGWFDVVLRRDQAFCLEFSRRLSIAAARSWWHWSLFSVAIIDGELSSAMCGFGDESVYRVSGDAMGEAGDGMGIDPAEQAQFWPRGAFIVSCVTSEANAWTVENVATVSGHRGSGVTEALLEHELDRARAAGFKRAQISFLIGNEPAEHAYRKVGFQFAEDKCSPEFEAAMGAPGYRRLVRDI
jgi:GNAT superfamily N-acetyltransferase